MIAKSCVLSLLALIVLPAFAMAHNVAASYDCSQTCNGGTPNINITYPFGFSPGCPIQLNCTKNGTACISEFPVLEVSSDSITVSVEAKCNRPLKIIDQLYSQNYAPSSKNAILLNNCSSPSSCELPASEAINTHFDARCDPSGNNSSNNSKIYNNSSSGNMSCYSELWKQQFSTISFLNREKLFRLNCGYLLSSIWGESLNNNSISLAVQVIQLRWWMNGDQCECSDDADCVHLSLQSVGGGQGYRCQCKDGFRGDGFAAGNGCQRDSFMCNPARYLSGQCGGTTRVIVLVGGVVVGASFMISLGLICFVLRRRHKLKAELRNRRLLSEATGECSIPFYSYREIERATSYFSEKHRLGTGAFGTVYAGKLHNDEWVAIKRIKHRDSIEQVMNEIKLLSSVSHPNLVKLLGCSIEKGEQILVYEFMPNGTLCQHLQRERGDGLAWPVRLNIACETAQAIAHLHSATPPIFHRDVKSSNIVLDYNLKSKVADFGLSRLGLLEDSHISTAPQGTPGYLDPQYHQDFHLSDRSDVYSLGVVLMEIITALRVVDFTRPPNEVNLANLATDRIGRGHLDEIIDPIINVRKDERTYSSVQKVAELAFQCLASHRDLRPSMKEVAEELERIRQSKWATSQDKSCINVSELSSPSSSSSSSEKSLICTETRKVPGKRITVGEQRGSSGISSVDNSTVSKDSWPSAENSPSSNCFNDQCDRVT